MYTYGSILNEFFFTFFPHPYSQFLRSFFLKFTYSIILGERFGPRGIHIIPDLIGSQGANRITAHDICYLNCPHW